MILAWTCLLLASVTEVCWTVGLKYSKTFTVLWPSVASIAAMIASVALLAISVRTIPIGTAYAVWSGLGAAFTVIAGIILFEEAKDVARLLCIGLILAGVVGLKLVGK